MTVTLKLKSGLDTQLQELARLRGLSLEVFLSRLIEEQVQSVRNHDALTLLSAWEKEDEIADPAIAEERRVDWEAFKAAMNEAHSANRVLFP